MSKIHITLILSILIFGACNKEKPLVTELPLRTKVVDSVQEKITLETELENKLYEQGINFYARGQEPFWSLDMDFDRYYHFKSINGEEMYVPNVPGEKAMGANMTRFYAHVEKGKLIVNLEKEPCQDSMADKIFDYKVNVQFKYGIDDEFREFSGCGNFLPDSRLHDIWVLESINDEELKFEVNQQQPRFEFYPKKNEIIGNTGCNNFTTKFNITGYQEIQIDPAKMTKKSCGNLEYEQVLINHLFGKRLSYSRDGLILTLRAYDGTQFQFKKVD